MTYRFSNYYYSWEYLYDTWLSEIFYDVDFFVALFGFKPDCIFDRDSDEMILLDDHNEG